MANKHAQRSEATRARLIEAGRELFMERGYAAVAMEDVVARAGVTRGALYHHFGGKRELFRAVFERVEEELMRTVAARVAEARAVNAVAALRAGIDAALEAASEERVARLSLVDAPAVLGWREWRAAGERHALGLVRATLAAGMDSGALARAPVDPLAQVLLAAVEEAALYVSRAERRDDARAQARQVLTRVVDGLRA
jgi:AcrR family transcriptional regulator